MQDADFRATAFWKVLEDCVTCIRGFSILCVSLQGDYNLLRKETF